MNKNKGQEPIRNVRAFITAYLGSKSGQAALNRQEKRFYDKKKRKFVTVYQSNAMALAFQKSVQA